MHRRQVEEITSVDPLNLALRAKSTTTRVWWWSITVIDIVALICGMTILISKYQRGQTKAAIYLKKNQAPFPAMTFCNLNPYKKSALATIPKLANLIDQFNNASKYNVNSSASASANGNPNNQWSPSKKRRKRSGDCCSKSGGIPSVVFASSAYYRCDDYKLSWIDSWSCCATNPPADIGFNSSRLARIDKAEVVNFLFNNSVINSHAEAWCGLKSDQISNAARYYWYNSVTSRSQPETAIGVSQICTSCTDANRLWEDGGSVNVFYNGTSVVFNNFWDYQNKINSYICEFTDAVASTTSFTKLSSSSFSNTFTSKPAMTSISSTTVSLSSSAAIESATQSPTTIMSLASSTNPMIATTSKPMSAILSTDAPTALASLSTDGASTSAIFKSSSHSLPNSLTSAFIATTSSSTKTGASSLPASVGITGPSTIPSSIPATSSPFVRFTTFTSSTPGTSASSALSSSLAQTMTTTTIHGSAFALLSQSIPASFSDRSTTVLSVNANLKTKQSTKLTSTVPQLQLQTSSTQGRNSSVFDLVKNDTSALSATMEDAMIYAIASLSDEEKEKAGFALSELLMRCVYNGVKCSFSDFELKIDSSYGNCHTFNYHGDYTIGDRAGATTGLSVTYNTRNSEYLDYLQTAGIRVVVHEKDEPVFASVMGFNVPSGYQSAAALTKVQTMTNRRVKPCASFPRDVSSYHYNNVSYSTEACIRSCYQNHIIKKCQCGDPRVPLPKSGRVQYCSLANRDCVNDNYDISSDVNCNCPSACRIVQHEITQTNTKWTTPYGKRMQWSTFNGTTHYNFTDTSDLARIDVYYQTVDTTEYEETMLYSWSELTWDLSSIIGLALGVSVISLFEVVQLEEWRRKKCRV